MADRTLRRSFVAGGTASCGGLPGDDTFDAGEFIDGTMFLCIGADCWQTPANGTNWTFSFATGPCAAFNASQQSGQWAPVITNNVNPITFACRNAGIEIIDAAYNGEPMPPAALNINAPTPTSWDAVTDQVAVVQQGGNTFIRAGRTGQVGIAVDFEAVNTGGSSGNLAAIQLVGTTRTLTKNDGSILTLSTGNHPCSISPGASRPISTSIAKLPLGHRCRFPIALLSRSTIP